MIMGFLAGRGRVDVSSFFRFNFGIRRIWLARRSCSVFKEEVSGFV